VVLQASRSADKNASSSSSTTSSSSSTTTPLPSRSLVGLRIPHNFAGIIGTSPPVPLFPRLSPSFHHQLFSTFSHSFFAYFYFLFFILFFALFSPLTGYVANSGRSVNVPVITKDWRFDFTTDARSTVPLNSTLIVPIRSQEGKVLGVLEALNSKNEMNSLAFSIDDEYNLKMLSAWSAPAPCPCSSCSCFSSFSSMCPVLPLFVLCDISLF
jgi:hypothetical protein